MNHTLETLTKEAIALPYDERVELLNSLARSLYQRNAEEKSHRVQNRLNALKKYKGCMDGLWANDDPVEYQQTLREDRAID